MNNSLIAIFFVTFMGGLISGMICSVVLLYVSGGLIQNEMARLQETIQNIEIDCSEEYVPGASMVKLGDQAYYCLFEIIRKGQDKEFIVNPVPEPGGSGIV